MNKRLTWCGICLISYLAMGQSILAQEQSESTLNMPISTVEASAVEVKSVEEQLDSVNIIVPDKEISAQQEEQVSVSLEEAIDSETDEQQKLLDKKEIAEETLEKVLEPSTAVTDTEVKEEGSKNEVSEKLEAEESDKETKVLSEVSINLENKEDDTERAESNVTKEQNEKENTTSFRTNANEDRYHKVKVGDTLWAISQRYNITLNDLLKLNNFSSANVVIHPGNLIKVSKATGTSSTPPQNNTNNGGGSGNTTVVNSYYTVVSGDSLWRIANQHGISVAELVTLNGWVSSNQIIHPGQQVIVKKTQSPSGNNVTGNQSQTTPSTNQTYNEYYTIVSGDSLWLIANKYGTSVDELVRLNGWASSNQMIHPGQQVIVKKGTSGKGNVHSNSNNNGQAANQSNTNQKRQRVLEVAKKYLGVPYIWGGKTPSGFDCSGFVGYVYKEALGKDITTWTVTQENAGTVRGLDGLLEGDLLFWGNRGNSTHVAIYVGNSTFIHAPYEGKNVSYLNMNYFMPQFSVRVIK